MIRKPRWGNNNGGEPSFDSLRSESMIKEQLKTVIEEQSPIGDPTGLEIDDIGNIVKPFDPEDIDVTTKPMTVDLLIARIGSSAINLQPDFRNYPPPNLER
jgi:hypothetical protein